MREDTGAFTVLDPLAWDAVKDAGTHGGADTAGPRIASIVGIEGSAAAGVETAQFRVKRLDKFSVNGQDEDGLVVEAPGGLATVQFYGWATRNQMPITRVTVDWGDRSEPTDGIGKYQNHKPYCATGEDLATSAFHCTQTQELTCRTNNDCPPVAGGPSNECKGAYCRFGCTEDVNCPDPVGDGVPKCTAGVCVRTGNRCLGNVDGSPCDTVGATCNPGDGSSSVCVDVNGSAIHRPLSCGPGGAGPDAGEVTACSVTISGETYQGTCIGFTSFGDFPDACSATPFTYRHTYRCDGVNDPKWNHTLGGCVFIPRVKLEDNWGWCTKGAAGIPSDLYCDDPDDPFIPFAGQVVVR
jgi:hypothetical protein